MTKKNEQTLLGKLLLERRRLPRNKILWELRAAGAISGKSVRTIEYWETKPRLPEPGQLGAIAAVYGIRPQDIGAAYVASRIHKTLKKALAEISYLGEKRKAAR